MEIVLAAVSIILATLAILLFVAYQKKGAADPLHNEKLNTLSQELRDIRSEMNRSVKDNLEFVQKEASRSGAMIASITERLTKLDETNRQVVNFADQLRSLQDILKNPKQRGVLGEYYLETLLKNTMPPGSYEMQFTLGVDENTNQKLIADAIVRVKDKLIPVDSKFSLENYNRLVEASSDEERDRYEKAFISDLKLRIQETAKYIRPDRGTLEFAFMFIPHEAIYYDLLINKVGAVTENTENLIQRAASKYHVIIVSPTSFLAYLQTVLQGMRAMQIEESAKEIRKNVELLGKHLGSYEEYMKKLGKNLGTTVGAYNDAYVELKKVDKDVLKIAGESAGIEPAKLDRPQGE